MFVIKKGNLYVAKSGSGSSYTYDIRKAEIYKTKKEAERNVCPENEHIVSFYTEFNI